MKEQPTRPTSQSKVLRRTSRCTLDQFRASLHMIARTSGTDPPATLPRARLAHQRNVPRGATSPWPAALGLRSSVLSTNQKSRVFEARFFEATLRLRFVTQLRAPEPSTSGRSIIASKMNARCLLCVQADRSIDRTVRSLTHTNSWLFITHTVTHTPLVSPCALEPALRFRFWRTLNVESVERAFVPPT